MKIGDKVLIEIVPDHGDNCAGCKYNSGEGCNAPERYIEFCNNAGEYGGFSIIFKHIEDNE